MPLQSITLRQWHEHCLMAFCLPMLLLRLRSCTSRLLLFDYFPPADLPAKWGIHLSVQWWAAPLPFYQWIIYANITATVFCAVSVSAIYSDKANGLSTTQFSTFCSDVAPLSFFKGHFKPFSCPILYPFLLCGSTYLSLLIDSKAWYTVRTALVQLSMIQFSMSLTHDVSSWCCNLFHFCRPRFSDYAVF